MTRSGRVRRRLSTRRSAVVRVAMLVTVALLVPACGSRDGSANPTVPTPLSTSPAVTTVPARPVQRFRGYSDPLFSRGAQWLCAEAKATDRCMVANQDTTIVRPDGRTEAHPSDPPADTPFDCFYVYGTASLPAPSDATVSRNTTAEDALVFQQAARLRELCRVYAPLYRQAGVMGDQSAAYGEVKAAFRHYMGQWNGGRRIVLFGQSQGAEHLAKLLQEDFDDDPELRGLLISAFLIGARVDTAPGARTGGTFRNIPTCGATTDTGCVVSWSTTSASTPRDVVARWGEAPAGRSRACVNPANPAGGAGLLTAIVPAEGERHTPAEVGTPFVELPEVLSAECVTTGQVTTLVVRPAAEAGDSRNPGSLLTNVPVWGLHVAEVSLALGSVMDLIAGQSGAAPPAPKTP